MAETKPRRRGSGETMGCGKGRRLCPSCSEVAKSAQKRCKKCGSLLRARDRTPSDLSDPGEASLHSPVAGAGGMRQMSQDDLFLDTSVYEPTPQPSPASQLQRAVRSRAEPPPPETYGIVDVEIVMPLRNGTVSTSAYAPPPPDYVALAQYNPRGHNIGVHAYATAGPAPPLAGPAPLARDDSFDTLMPVHTLKMKRFLSKDDDASRFEGRTAPYFNTGLGSFDEMTLANTGSSVDFGSIHSDGPLGSDDAAGVLGVAVGGGGGGGGSSRSADSSAAGARLDGAAGGLDSDSLDALPATSPSIEKWHMSFGSAYQELTMPLSVAGEEADQRVAASGSGAEATAAGDAALAPVAEYNNLGAARRRSNSGDSLSSSASNVEVNASRAFEERGASYLEGEGMDEAFFGDSALAEVPELRLQFATISMLEPAAVAAAAGGGGGVEER